MVDHVKRNSLKQFASIGMGVVAGTSSAQALANQYTHAQADHIEPFTSNTLNNDLAEIEVSTRFSPTGNDLEIVLTNKGASSARITDMTPAEINTPRGRFDFDALFADGDVLLNSGAQVSVPMQYHTVVLDGTSMHKRSMQLGKALKQNVSIVTDGNALAAVSFNNQWQKVV